MGDGRAGGADLGSGGGGPVRRRLPPVPADPPPDRLVTFRVEDWPVPAPPAWWSDGEEDWQWFKGRLLWQEAVRVWRSGRGVDLGGWARLRDAAR